MGWVHQYDSLRQLVGESPNMNVISFFTDHSRFFIVVLTISAVVTAILWCIQYNQGD